MSEFTEAEKRNARGQVLRLQRKANSVNIRGNLLRVESDDLLRDSGDLFYAAKALMEKYGLEDLPLGASLDEIAF